MERLVFPPSAPFVLLEDRLTPHAPARLYRDPVSVVRCEKPSDVAEAFERIEAGLAAGLHAAGFCAYELGYALEPRMAPGPPQPGAGAPLLWMGLFASPTLASAAIIDDAFAGLGPPAPLGALVPDLDASAHAYRVRRIKALIAAGVIYQANLTFKMRFNGCTDPLKLYAALRTRQPTAHCGVVILDDLAVLSVSPELWIESRDGQATTRPMKGTQARRADVTEDAAARAALLADPKQRAENVMITDLLRNDLSRISRRGSVRTPALFTVETYPTFHALTSTVTATLRPESNLMARFVALFPCGSIVGAPKIRAAEVIRDLESEPRGVYTGGLGEIAPNGDMRFNVAIRTAVVMSDGRGDYGVGGGIVADSTPADEYDEALLKSRVLEDLAPAYQLIETFRWSVTIGFVRLDRHLARLEASASLLGFAFDRAAAWDILDREARAWTVWEDRRVRLSLDRDGTMDVRVSPVAPPSDYVMRVTRARAVLDGGDPFLRHKTTQRAVYDAAFAEAVDLGFDEALLLNRHGGVAEASRNTVFVSKDGRWITPPLSAGVLPGVLRQALLEAGEVREGELTPEDLRRAPVWRLGNSLHGLRDAVLLGE